MPEKEKIIAGGLTQAQIARLRNKHGKLRLITLKIAQEDEAEHRYNEEHYWFKHPDMKTMSAVAKFADSDPVKSSQIFFSQCLVEGDEEAVNNTSKFMSISPHIMDMIETHQTEVKNF